MAVVYSQNGVVVRGGGGAVLGEVHLQACVPVSGGIKVVDKNGYIGGDFYGAYYPQNYNFYNNFVIVDEKANFSDTQLGQVTLLVPGEDEIGGRKYKTVTIGTQTWLAENLDYKVSGINIGQNPQSGTPNASYYNNDENTYGVNGRKDGLLYNWYAVKLMNDNRADIFPGWHVPDTTEIETLLTTVGGSSTAAAVLRSASYWSSGTWTDPYGFSLQPSGRDNGEGNSFVLLNTNAFIWTNMSYSGTDARYYYVNPNELGVYASINSKRCGYSVRLVKDS